jgi:SHS2 domain-containing protein
LATLLGEDKVPQEYEYIDHTGDLGFRAYGKTREALFAHAARALFEVLVSPETVEAKEERVVVVEAAALDELMVSWLAELVYLFDTEGLLLKEFEIKRLTEKHLDASVWGEPLDPRRHEVKTGIKAVTYHQLYVKKENGTWETQVILDL